MNQLLLGRYMAGDSWIHRLDPRAKLGAGIGFIGILFLMNNWPTALLLWSFTFLVMFVTRIGLSIYVRGVRPLIWIILFTVGMQLFFTAGGKIYWEWGIFTISQHGMRQGLLAFSRFVMLVFISTVITLTTKPMDLADAIHDLMKPLQRLRIPAAEFAFMLSISLRLIPTLLDETQRVIDAQRSRGARIGEGSLLLQMRALVPIFLPFFSITLKRAEEMADAMEVRGYRPGVKRSRFRRFTWHARDTIALLVMVILTYCLLQLRS